MHQLKTAVVIMAIHQCLMVGFCLSNKIFMRTMKYSRSTNDPDENLPAKQSDFSKVSLVECALKTLVNTKERFLFNGETSECIVEEGDAFAFNTPVGFARFIQDIEEDDYPNPSEASATSTSLIPNTSESDLAGNILPNMEDDIPMDISNSVQDKSTSAEEISSAKTTSMIPKGLVPDLAGNILPSISDVIPQDILNNVQGLIDMGQFPKQSDENEQSQGQAGRIEPKETQEGAKKNEEDINSPQYPWYM